MKNRSKTKDHKINVILRVDAVNYTGVVKDNVKRLNEDTMIKAKESKSFFLVYFPKGRRLCYHIFFQSFLPKEND